MKKKCLIFVTILICLLTLKAQKISGKIQDKDGNTISFAEISAVKGSIIQNSLTDESGNFVIKLPENGNYLIKVLQYGEEVLSENILIDGETQQNFEISLKTTKLQELAITGQKKIVEQIGDKTYFNVENSILSTGNSGMEILQKSPEISVNSEGQIVLKNKNVSILINGRKANLNKEDLNTYLSNLNSEEIKRIEIQEVASQDQDANTGNGVVNIILKKNQKGFKAIAKTSYLYRDKNYDNYTGNINLNFGAEKFNIYSSASYSENTNRGKSTGIFNYFSGQKNINITDIQTHYDNANFRLGGVYYPNEKNELGIEGYYSKTNANWFLKSNLNIFDNNSLLINSTNVSRTNSETELWYITANYSLKTEEDGIFKIIAETGKNKSDPHNRVVAEYPEQPEENSDYLFDTHSSSEYYTIQADWEQKIKNDWTLSTGAKFGNISRDNLLLVTYLQNNNWSSDDNRNQDFNNNENILAAYVNLSKKLGKYFIKAGLRSENTDVKGLNMLNSQNVKQNYTKFFPTFYYKFEIDKDHNLTATYRKSISRPSFRDLNPFIIKENDFLYQVGNPYLKPFYSDYAELAYNYKKHSFSLYGTKSKGVILSTYSTDDDMVNYYQPNNFGENMAVGLDYSFGGNIAKWLFTNISAGINHNYFDSNDGIKNSGTSFYNNIYAQVKLPKNFVFEFLNDYSHNGVYNFIDFAQQYRMDLSLRKSFMDGDLLATLKANDVFNTARDKNTSHFKNFDFNFYQKNITRSYMLQIQYTFDNKKNMKSGTVKSDSESRSRL